MGERAGARMSLCISVDFFYTQSDFDKFEVAFGVTFHCPWLRALTKVSKTQQFLAPRCLTCVVDFVETQTS